MFLNSKSLRKAF